MRHRDPHGKHKLLRPGVRAHFDETKASAIIEHLRFGNYFETAACAAGVHYNTARTWLRKGAEGHPQFEQFHADVERAMAEAETTMVRVVTMASLKDWRAAAWRLTRRHPERWAARAKLGTAEVQQMLAELSDEELETLADLIDQTKETEDAKLGSR